MGGGGAPRHHGQNNGGHAAQTSWLLPCMAALRRKCCRTGDIFHESPVDLPVKLREAKLYVACEEFFSMCGLDGTCGWQSKTCCFRGQCSRNSTAFDFR